VNQERTEAGVFEAVFLKKKRPAHLNGGRPFTRVGTARNLTLLRDPHGRVGAHYEVRPLRSRRHQCPSLLDRMINTVFDPAPEPSGLDLGPLCLSAHDPSRLRTGPRRKQQSNARPYCRATDKQSHSSCDWSILQHRTTSFLNTQND